MGTVETGSVIFLSSWHVMVGLEDGMALGTGVVGEVDGRWVILGDCDGIWEGASDGERVGDPLGWCDTEGTKEG